MLPRPARILAVAASASALSACASDGPGGGPEAPERGRSKVASVTDGDTIRLVDGSRVRLLQIDAPETREPAECWGPQATRALERLLKRGDTIRLARDPALDDVDDYGRLLRYVTGPEGELVNLQLVAEGHAVPYFYRGDEGVHAGELLDAARAAQQAKRGLWGACPSAQLTPGTGYRE